MSPAGNAATDPSTELILAAGAVIWRRSTCTDAIEIVVIHRPRYDDWSFPKGKLQSGEAPREAARREVKEETGLDCVLGVALPTRHYLARGRPKEVRYWTATTTGGSFAPNREVDRLVWLPASAARERLSQDHDRPLVGALLAALKSE